jgi:hypothetical protein
MVILRVPTSYGRGSGSRSGRLNHKWFYIVLLAGHHDVGVMPFVFRNRFGE